MLKTLYIKDMICPRCIRVIEHLLTSLQVKKFTVELGKIQLDENFDEQVLATHLEREGFSIVYDADKIITEQVKNLMVDLCSANKLANLGTTLSFYVSEELNVSYASICESFKKTENRTIEQYWQCLRIEKTKEFLEYNQLSLEEIALQVGYLSQQALSKAFKKATGLSPRGYKKLELGQRKTLDNV